MGTYLATLLINQGGALTYERTFLERVGHHTDWGAPEEFLKVVTNVDPIERVS